MGIFRRGRDLRSAGLVSAGADQGELLESAHLYEYAALKSEQTTRMTLRETALYLNIIVTISIFAVYFQSEVGKQAILLCVPSVSLILFWIYRSNDAVVTIIRNYIKHELDVGRRDSSPNETKTHWFGWETYHRRISIGRVLRKVVNLFVGSLSFLGPSAIALLIAAGISEIDSSTIDILITRLTTHSVEHAIFWWIGCTQFLAMAVWMLVTIDLRG